MPTVNKCTQSKCKALISYSGPKTPKTCESCRDFSRRRHAAKRKRYQEAKEAEATQKRALVDAPHAGRNLRVPEVVGTNGDSPNVFPPPTNNSAPEPEVNEDPKKAVLFTDQQSIFDESSAHVDVQPKETSTHPAPDASPTDLKRPRKRPRTSRALDPVQEERTRLPIAQARDEVVHNIAQHDVVVIIGETGSGKSTQVPQYLLEARFAKAGLIGVAEPCAATTAMLASRVTIEQGTLPSGLVGYVIPFEKSHGPETSNSQPLDPLLSRYAVLIIDDAHKRTLPTDLLLANVKRILRVRNNEERAQVKGKEREKERNPLKVVIMGATPDTEEFSRFFLSSNPQIIHIKERQHPVKIFHVAQDQPDHIGAAVRAFFQVHVGQPSGDVLIFLPGAQDIELVRNSIHLLARKLPPGHDGLLLVSICAALTGAQLRRTFDEAPRNTDTSQLFQLLSLF
ncbi:P-loop containing nucleoside triphosphate hydrolase protein [Mycena alexandri]|uniref:P-loop containing nucleoside triphosphate hydrolase protein n=1 Tax=Mycena alexandri TaxID=1745969 RepID=A0AAD6WRZ5_9AGAR|nr:P-loop containing nucleoside triphosphate hydrolase protein [Mycena alexandri]